MTNEANDRVSGRVQRSTSSLLRNLRSLRTIVFHPRDSDGEVLTEQLKRIGCQVVTMWPPLAEIPDTVDVVFCAVRPDHAANECKWMGSDPVLPIIAIVNYENPTILDAALRMGALTVLTTPARASGILSSLAVAKHLYEERKDLRKRVDRLQQKLQSANDISQAKAVLVRTHNITDEEAYRIIREQAMSRRIATEDIAKAIIQADGLLSYTER